MCRPVTSTPTGSERSRIQGGLVADWCRARDSLGSVGGDASGVGDCDVEGGVSGLRTEVAHEGEEHLKFAGGGLVGKHYGGVGEVGFAGEGIARVGEQFQVGQGGPVGNAGDVEVRVFEDRALQVPGGAAGAIPSVRGLEGEVQRERVGERAQVD